MIYLSTTEPKKVVLQSNKNSTSNSTEADLLTNYYTFKMTSTDSFEEYVFSPKNNSSSPYYDAFTISVGTTSISMTNSVKIDAASGQYNFEVYKMPTEFNLNIASASYLTESGIIQVVGEDFVYGSLIVVPDAFTASDADTIKVFTEL